MKEEKNNLCKNCTHYMKIPVMDHTLPYCGNTRTKEPPYQIGYLSSEAPACPFFEDAQPTRKDWQADQTETPFTTNKGSGFVRREVLLPLITTTILISIHRTFAEREYTEVLMATGTLAVVGIIWALVAALINRLNKNQ